MCIAELGLMLRASGTGRGVCSTARAFRPILTGERHDVLLLATALGNGLDGFSVCRRLRAAGDGIPIIMLGDDRWGGDIVTGLEAGADDFMTKPVRLAELRTRMKALLRRERYGASVPPLRLRHVVLDHSAREVTRDAQPVALTHTEYELLLVLISKAGCVCSREELLRAARGTTTFTDPRSIDVYIHHLRHKLERDPSIPDTHPDRPRRWLQGGPRGGRAHRPRAIGPVRVRVPRRDRHG